MSSVLPSASDKSRYVAAMFGRIARRYDLMNSLITLGQDARWRRRVAGALDGLPPSARVLDVGTGTGRLAEAVEEQLSGPTVIGVDFTVPMLRLAADGLRRAAADALSLPFADGQFEGVVSGFLVRNLADLERGLAEQVRVLRPGGVLAILETTPGPPTWPISALFHLYFRMLVPVLGKLVAGDATAYTYLPESTLRFVRPAQLEKRLRALGLVDVHVDLMMFGSVALTTARKRGYPSRPGEVL
ncbi:MAG: ubiquinone/menaquinone biosynthesis methyltransferase [Chloroflexi bacterium]|nr:ubiquinone/menaquinone biosynthesis methyltransferase [Chloroflexota bacterium]